jgi:serine/threonine protein kinase
MIGKTLGHYRIAEKLGAGGMGEVYRAEDTNLHRHVAIKVLPDEFAHDAERLARFQREAQVLASLNHPNIATLHGLEVSDGKHFIVMELVEGQTLAHRLLRGPLPVDEALEVCRQIAEGLEAAHEKGVIHRDLKPGNVMITPDEKVKILDFGLAKALADEPQAADATHSPTITQAMTHPGVVLGTAAYMSPEQARGKPVDKRSDIWAFGCILFECLTGKRIFEGVSITETLASILKEEPDWQALPPVIPWKLKDLLHRCLQKDPRERLRDIGDGRIEIAGAKVAPSSATPESVDRVSTRWRTAPWVLFAVMALVAAGLALQFMMAPDRQPPPTRRFTLSLPEPLEDWEEPSLAISPDGMQVAYFAGSRFSGSKSSRLYCLRLDQAEFKLLPGAEGGHGPFFSPDGKEIGFFAEERLKKLPVAGGAVVPLTGSIGIDPSGGSWGTDDCIYLQRFWGGGLARVRASGGIPEVVLKPDPGKSERGLLWPQRLPADELLLSTAFTGDISSFSDAHVAIGRIGERAGVRYLLGGTYGRYLSTGHLVYAYDGRIMAAGLDLATQTITTRTAMVLEGIQMAPTNGVAQFAVANTGDLVYAPGAMVKCRDSLAQIDRAGKQESISLPFAENESLFVYSPNLSQDGTRLAIMLLKANNDIHVYDFSSRILTRASYEAGDEGSPVWAPDGKGLYYTSEGGQGLQMLRKQDVGNARSEPIFGGENPRYPWSFSPDGSVLAFVERHPETGWDIWTGPVGGNGQARPFKNTAYSESHPLFSPDGRWIAYVSDQSGQKQVYVARYPDGSDERQISQDGGTEPRWASSGKELYYLDGRSIRAVETSLSPTFSFGASKVLFSVDESLDITVFPYSSYAVTPDGQRFYFVKKNRAAPVTQLRVVLNWFEELKRLCPIGK